MSVNVARRRSLPSAVYETKPENKLLWHYFGRPGTSYNIRNVEIAAMVALAKSRRVFEFAGNGGGGGGEGGREGPWLLASIFTCQRAFN